MRFPIAAWLRVQIFLSLALWSASASAQGSIETQWVKGAQIVSVHVYPQEGGNMYIQLTKPVESTCTAATSASNKHYFQLDPSFPGFKEQYTLLLTAFTTGKTLDIYVTSCGNAYPIVRNTVVHR